MELAHRVELSDIPDRPHVVWFDDIEGQIPVPFRSLGTLRRFLDLLPSPDTIQLSERDRDRLTTLVINEEHSLIQASPVHATFLRRIASVAWSAQVPSSKRNQLLALFRPLVSQRALTCLSRLKPEVLVARVQAENSAPEVFPEQVA